MEDNFENKKEESPGTVSWTSDLRALGDIRDDSHLPCVCKLSADDTKALPAGLSIYCDQPLYMYMRRQRKQVLGRTIYHDASGPYYEVGQTLIIPDNFEGWFEIVPSDFGKSKVFTSIEEVSKIMPRKIFTRTTITGIRIVEENGQQTFKERKIPAGSILLVDSALSAKWETRAEKSVRKKKMEELTTIEIQYLKCTDTDQKEVLVPFSTKGRFSSVYEKDANNERSIYRIKDLISDFDMPTIVRLVYGKAPVVPCIFTGMIALRETVSEDVIIASTVMNKRNVLIEIPISSSCVVCFPENEEPLKGLKTFEDAQKLCEKYAVSFSSLIKLSSELDTHHMKVQYNPKMSKVKDSGLKTLDLITNISLADDEPSDRFMESDSDSIQSTDQSMPTRGIFKLLELTELKRKSTDC
ncbi:uncharacterized protein LOC134236870 [Saccostrea cucullata]|uniref:uncharacterized protein LOC134236870 n=1 Tax=Saccostrea cuccullata TaxID=36930 RepID=UPI002ED0107D